MSEQRSNDSVELADRIYDGGEQVWVRGRRIVMKEGWFSGRRKPRRNQKVALLSGAFPIRNGAREYP